MSQIAAADLLEGLPDFTSWDEAQGWIKDMQELPLDGISNAQFALLEWSDIQEEPKSSFGLYASTNWRKFVLATFAADLVSYPEPVDQVNFDRLLFVMHAFPQGFRTWWIKLANQPWRPVGYTGWYPMLDTMFETFQNSPEKLKNRMVVPNNTIDGDGPILYLFNFSCAAELKKTALSKALMARCAEDIAKQNPKGLACITVSDDGIRIAKRFGMACSGHLTIDNTPEGVFVTRK